MVVLYEDSENAMNIQVSDEEEQHTHGGSRKRYKAKSPSRTVRDLAIMIFLELISSV